MRFFRFTLFQSYLVFLSKNKTKALTLINIGIFFSIFALSAAIISFNIERQISIKQDELLTNQIEVNDFNQMINEIEIALNTYGLSLDAEEVYRVETQLLSETKLGEKIFSEHDFYGPFITSFKRTLIDEMEKFKSEEGGMDIYNIKDETMSLIINDVENAWNEEDADNFKKYMIAAGKHHEIVKNINYDKYDFKTTPNLEQVVYEIENFEHFHINKSTSEISDDYFKTLRYGFATNRYMEQLSKYFKGLIAKLEDNIVIINDEIILLSTKEKNIILITFIFQFFIFIIIQVFEINSLNYNLKRKPK